MANVPAQEAHEKAVRILHDALRSRRWITPDEAVVIERGMTALADGGATVALRHPIPETERIWWHERIEKQREHLAKLNQVVAGLRESRDALRTRAQAAERVSAAATGAMLEQAEIPEEPGLPEIAASVPAMKSAERDALLVAQIERWRSDAIRLKIRCARVHRSRTYWRARAGAAADAPDPTEPQEAS